MEINTPGGHKLMTKDGLSGGDRRELNKVFFPDIKIKMSDAVAQARAAGTETESVLPQSMEDTEVSAEVSMEIEDVLIRRAIISFDGSTEDIHDKVMDLPEADFDFVIAALYPLLKKKPSPTS